MANLVAEPMAGQSTEIERMVDAGIHRPLDSPARSQAGVRREARAYGAAEPKPSPPAIGAHVFDAFGEPADRVKGVWDTDFLLGRPLARDVYVPFSAIRWPGRHSLRIGVANAQLGAMGWQQPKLLGLFDG
jgi:hypothetical protein